MQPHVFIISLTCRVDFLKIFLFYSTEIELFRSQIAGKYIISGIISFLFNFLFLVSSRRHSQNWIHYLQKVLSFKIEFCLIVKAFRSVDLWWFMIYICMPLCRSVRDLWRVSNFISITILFLEPLLNSIN